MEEFIDRSRNIHGDKYDYSRVNYTNCMNLVEIVCSRHGIFQQTPLNHIQGHVCKKCAREEIAFNQRKSIEFIEKSNLKYGYKYDYSKVNYINRRTKVSIICPIHGDFEETPINHLTRNGCNECSRSERILLNSLNFIKKSKKIHGDKYDYSNVNYLSDKIKVSIICPIHGEFKQQPNTHLNGVGCPSCSSSKGESRISNFLISNGISFKREHKFLDCSYKKPLPFDFYLDDHNICIEYDGQQHQKSINFFGGELYFRNIKTRDEIKNKYCLENNIRILRITYNDYNNIEKIIGNELWANC